MPNSESELNPKLAQDIEEALRRMPPLSPAPLIITIGGSPLVIRVRPKPAPEP